MRHRNSALNPKKRVKKYDGPKRFLVPVVRWGVLLGERCLKCMHGKKAKFDYARHDSTGHSHFRRKVTSGKNAGKWIGCPFGANADKGTLPTTPHGTVT